MGTAHQILFHTTVGTMLSQISHWKIVYQKNKKEDTDLTQSLCHMQYSNSYATNAALNTMSSVIRI